MSLIKKNLILYHFQEDKFCKNTIISDKQQFGVFVSDQFPKFAANSDICSWLITSVNDEEITVIIDKGEKN